jgi:hypothetical protein
MAVISTRTPGYTLIPSEYVLDARLSMGAIGVMAYVHFKPGITIRGLLERFPTMKSREARKYVHELVSMNYATFDGAAINPVVKV